MYDRNDRTGDNEAEKFTVTKLLFHKRGTMNYKILTNVM